MVCGRGLIRAAFGRSPSVGVCVCVGVGRVWAWRGHGCGRGVARVEAYGRSESGDVRLPGHVGLHPELLHRQSRYQTLDFLSPSRDSTP